MFLLLVLALPCELGCGDLLGFSAWDGMGSLGWDGFAVGQLHALHVTSKGIHSERRLWLNLILNPGESKMLRLL